MPRSEKISDLAEMVLAFSKSNPRETVRVIYFIMENHSDGDSHVDCLVFWGDEHYSAISFYLDHGDKEDLPTLSREYIGPLFSGRNIHLEEVHPPRSSRFVNYLREDKLPEFIFGSDHSS